MKTARIRNGAQPAKVPVARPEPELGDIRFRKLIPAEHWNLLPAEVRQRFSKRLTGGATAIYVGEVKEVRISILGRILANLLRVIGAPLPLSEDVNVPTVVTVTEDVKTGGQVWSRTYCNRRGFPQVIHSAKQFAGPTGLQEHIGCGVSMALEIGAGAQGLVFRSHSFRVRKGPFTLQLPRFLTPGDVTVSHLARDGRTFEFSLDVRHPVFGEMIHQSAVYHDQ